MINKKSITGFSVVELMVALAISGFMLIGLIQIFSSVRASYELQEALARLQENARFAESFISQQITGAGDISFARHERDGQEASFGLSAISPFSLLNIEDMRPAIDVNQTTEGSTNSADALTINHYTDIDCTGAIGNDIGHKQITFSYDPGDEALLYTCRYGPPQSAGNPPVIINNQPILNNVQTLQFIYGDAYGSDTCPTDVNNPFIQSPERVRAQAAVRYARVDNFCGPESIVAVRVGLILTSPVINSLPEDNQTITMLEPGVNTASNTYGPTGLRHLRRPLIFNVNLRNRTF